MWVVVHFASGLSLGALLGLPLIVLLPLALVLHVLLDLVPHWDYTGHPLRRLWAGLDVSAAVLFAVLLAPALDLPWTAVLAGAVSALPDLDVLNEVLPLNRRRRVFPSHWRGFPHGRCRARTGIPLQLLVVSVSLALVAV